MVQKKKEMIGNCGFIGGLMAFAVVCTLFLPMNVQASNVTSGKLGENYGIEWTYDGDTDTLTVTGEESDFGGGSYSPFYPQFKNVEKIVMKDCKLSGSAFALFVGLSDLETIEFDNFDTGNVTDMGYMFKNCTKLKNLDLSSFDTSNVESMSDMFAGCSKLTSLDLSSFDTENVIHMGQMFSECSDLISLDLSSFDTANVTDMNSMFYECSSLTDLDISSFNTGKVVGMSCLFYGCSKLTSLDVSGFDTSSVESMISMFHTCSKLTGIDVSKFDTGNVSKMNAMFAGCSSLESLDVSNFDTQNVEDMSSMFYDCSSLKSLDLSNFNTGDVENMGKMFYCCSGLTNLDLSNFDTGNVEFMNRMFSYCSGLESLGLSNFDTGNVETMYGMFSGCSGLESLDLSNFDTGNVESMSEMFSGCSGLTSLNLSGFNTSDVTDMLGMFSGCSSLKSLDLSSFDTSSLGTVVSLFGDNSLLEKIYTPSNMASGQRIGLPGKFLDSKGNVTSAITIDFCNDILTRAVELIVLSDRNLTLEDGEYYTLTATVLPEAAYNKAVTWSTSDDTVALVNKKGEIEALKAGTAIITVASVENSEISASCTVTVEEVNPFADVSSDEWYYPYVKKAYNRGIMSGKATSEDGLIVFDPMAEMTRAEFVQILYAMEGKPEVTYTAIFKDVPNPAEDSNAWYANAVIWAAENELVSGVGAGEFGVSGKITREQMALILYGYASKLGYEAEGRADLSHFVDVDQIDGWAEEAMKWAVEYKIMSGASGGKLNPRGNTSRAEAATMLNAFISYPVRPVY